MTSQRQHSWSKVDWPDGQPHNSRVEMVLLHGIEAPNLWNKKCNTIFLRCLKLLAIEERLKCHHALKLLPAAMLADRIDCTSTFLLVCCPRDLVTPFRNGWSKSPADHF